MIKIHSLLLFIFFLIYFASCQNDVLLEKLGDNADLKKKYSLFIENGTELKIGVPKKKINNFIDTALSYIGTPNKYAGTDYDGIDASGLVFVSFKKNFDIDFPRTSQEMAKYGKIIDTHVMLKRGDLVFFINTYDSENLITTTGIYIGNNEFIHSSTSEGVKISLITDPLYWKDKFFFGTRIFH